MNKNVLLDGLAIGIAANVVAFGAAYVLFMMPETALWIIVVLAVIWSIIRLFTIKW